MQFFFSAFFRVCVCVSSPPHVWMFSHYLRQYKLAELLQSITINQTWWGSMQRILSLFTTSSITALLDARTLFQIEWTLFLYDSSERWCLFFFFFGFVLFLILFFFFLRLTWTWLHEAGVKVCVYSTCALYRDDPHVPISFASGAVLVSIIFFLFGFLSRILITFKLFHFTFKITCSHLLYETLCVLGDYCV